MSDYLKNDRVEELLGKLAQTRDDRRSQLVVKLRGLQTWMERIGERDLGHCSVAEARLFVTALDVIKGLAGDMAEGLDEEDEGEEE